MEITPVILCGGSGTRLWPLSRKSLPKQFVPLINNKSLLQLTIERFASVASNEEPTFTCKHIVCVASEEHKFLVSDTLAASNLGSRADSVAKTVLLEPVGKNTAAAMALVSLTVKPIDGLDSLFLFCPADHHIPDTLAFFESIKQGVAAAKQGAIVTFGVVPTFPSTSYGYIKQGAKRQDGSLSVESFIEKPNSRDAQDLLLQGGIYWNAGIFLMSLQTLKIALETYAPDILKSCEAAMATSTHEFIASGQSVLLNDLDPTYLRPGLEAFNACRNESIDYAVMEHFPQMALVHFQGQWSDVGSWATVANLYPADSDGNRIDGNGVALHSSNTFVHAPKRIVVALGTQDLLIVDTADALLVAHRDYSESVKEAVKLLEKGNLTEAVTHRKVARPWGWFDSVDIGERFQVKRIGVKPGASLSLQKHHHRAEHWIVVVGTAEVTRGKETFLLSENQSTYIPIGEIHRLKNPGKVYLEMIEVQSGGYLGEDDIVRLEDTYGRAS
jgi:mannose-1-phosphate guanylyltransferase / mannose-6-phosphate isomerase